MGDQAEDMGEKRLRGEGESKMSGRTVIRNGQVQTEDSYLQYGVDTFWSVVNGVGTFFTTMFYGADAAARYDRLSGWRRPGPSYGTEQRAQRAAVQGAAHGLLRPVRFAALIWQRTCNGLYTLMEGGRTVALLNG